MNQPNPTPPPASGTAFRVLPGPVLEIHGPGVSAKVALTPMDALAIVQALIFHVREQFFPLESRADGHTK